MSYNKGIQIKIKGPNKFALVFHEYLGLLGIETNYGTFSTYPISSRILSYVHATKKYELRFENNNDCKVSMDPFEFERFAEVFREKGFKPTKKEGAYFGFNYGPLGSYISEVNGGVALWVESGNGGQEGL